MTPETYPVEVKCPYCGLKSVLHVKRYAYTPQVVYCEEEKGGCGATYAVTAIVTVTVTPTVRTIEGMGPDPETLAYIRRREEGGEP